MPTGGTMKSSDAVGRMILLACILASASAQPKQSFSLEYPRTVWLELSKILWKQVVEGERVGYTSLCFYSHTAKAPRIMLEGTGVEGILWRREGRSTCGRIPIPIRQTSDRTTLPAVLLLQTGPTTVDPNSLRLVGGTCSGLPEAPLIAEPAALPKGRFRAVVLPDLARGCYEVDWAHITDD